MRIIQSLVTGAALALSVSAVSYAFNTRQEFTQMQAKAGENVAKSEFDKEYTEFRSDYARLNDHLRQMLQQSRVDFPEVWQDRSMAVGSGQFGSFTASEISEILTATYQSAKGNLADVKSVNFIENLKSMKSIVFGLDANSNNIDVLRLGHSDPKSANYYYVSPFYSQHVSNLMQFKTMIEKMRDLHELYAPTPKSLPTEKSGSGVKVSAAHNYRNLSDRGMA